MIDKLIILLRDGETTVSVDSYSVTNDEINSAIRTLQEWLALRMRVKAVVERE